MCTIEGYELTCSSLGNEEQVGRAIKDSGVPRKEFFVTTKLPNHRHDKVREAFESSLAALGMDYIDLYLVHWPQAATMQHREGILQPGEKPTFTETWKEMEKLLGTGKVRAIGVSNFSIKTLTTLLPDCSVIPAVNQVELHPCLPQEDLKAFCDSKGITVTAYSPLGQFQTVLHSDPTIRSIAAKHGLEANAQIVLSWAVQRGIAVIPRSENIDRMKANISLVHLSEEQMKIIDGVHEQPDMHKSLVSNHNVENGTVLGWTYEQLGWKMKIGGIAYK